MARIHELFRLMVDLGASDLHLGAELTPRVRVHGELEEIPGWEAQSDEGLNSMLREITGEAQWQSFEQTGDLDFAYGLPDVARLRANFLRQHHGVAAVFRVIPEEIIQLETLGMPDSVADLADLEDGLVLVTGPTGSGKSTTLAAVIDRINRRHQKHIVTIEDPVEFVHRNQGCVLSQREVGTDTSSFGDALRSAIRQDADVILVGEMRDLETISLAITAAEMGSLVFGTLHTNGAVNTIDRLVDAFPTEEQAQVRTTLAESLAAVVSQLLLPTADGQGRVAAVEILLRSAGLPNVIREGNTPMLHTLMQAGGSQGMQTMDEALVNLVRSGKITADQGGRRAHDKVRFERSLAQ